MTGLTTLYHLPYPETSDELEDALTTIPQDLAEAIESTISGFGGIASPTSWVSVGGGGGAPAFATNWGNPGAGNPTVQYRKVGNMLFLRGLALRSTSTATSPSTIFTLPSGFRPLTNLLFPCATSAGYARLQVNSDGTVKIEQATTAGQGIALQLPVIWLD